jgi:hypothetical protein
LYANPAANPPNFVTIDYSNVGKTPAHRGMTILFSQTESGDHCEELGTANIGNLALNQSTTIAPGAGGNSQITVDMTKFLRLFVVSISYFDDGGSRYDARFAYKLGARAFDNATTWLDEVPLGISSNCGAK